MVAATMATVFLLVMVLYGTISSQHPESLHFKHDDQLLGNPLYKLDTLWPKYPELFGGNVFGVAVNHHAEVVYVAQRGKCAILIIIILVLISTTHYDLI